MDFDSEKIDRVLNNPFFIGGVGSIISLRWAPGLTWLERLFNVICGLMLAGYLAPFTVEYLKLTSPAMFSGSAFMIGLFGMNLIAAINNGIRNVSKEDLLAMIPWSRKGQ